MIDVSSLPMDKQKALALIRATEKRALEEQDIWRNRIASLRGRCRPRESLERIRAMGPAEFMRRLNELPYRSTPDDRRRIDSNWDESAYEMNEFPEVADAQLRGPLEHCNRIIEHRDRLKGIAMFNELVAFDCTSTEPRTRGLCLLERIWSIFASGRAAEEMIVLVKARADHVAAARYTRLREFNREMLVGFLPTTDAIAAADEAVEPDSPEIRREVQEVLEGIRELRKLLAAPNAQNSEIWRTLRAQRKQAMDRYNSEGGNQGGL